MIIIRTLNELLDDMSYGLKNEEDIIYFESVTRPLFQKLYELTAERVDSIEKRIDDTHKNKNVQSKIFIGDIDVNNPILKSGEIDNIIGVNDDIKSFDSKRIKYTLPHRLSSKKPLFSLFCDVPYNQYLSYHNKKIYAEIIDENNNRLEVELTCRLNDDYKSAEILLKSLCRTNGYEGVYYDIPICRRYIDVFFESAEDCKMKSIVALECDCLFGELKIPVWNVKRVKNKTISNKKCSPYSFDPNRKIYIGEIAIRDEGVLDCLADDRINNNSMLYTIFEESKLEIYTMDVDYLKKEFDILQIRKVMKSWTDVLNPYCSIYETEECVQFSSLASKGMIWRKIRELSQITRIIVQNIVVDKDKVTLIIKSNDHNCLEYEMSSFLIEQLKAFYPRYIFEVQYE